MSNPTLPKKTLIVRSKQKVIVYDFNANVKTEISLIDKKDKRCSLN
ncbi:hypothetical protein [Halarcobacter ebronensis]|nr:hypothetical protein [Halarcobacter ebronensis]